MSEFIVPEWRQALSAGLSRDRAAAWVRKGEWWLFCPMCGEVRPGLDDDGQRIPLMACARAGRTVWVDWPAESFNEELVTILSVRQVENQLWFPSESLDTVRGENVAHGLSACGAS